MVDGRRRSSRPGSHDRGLQADKYPNIEFINAAVAGGAGTNARAVLATRLQAGDAARLAGRAMPVRN